MNLKKFIGPVILAGISILIFVSINISANTQYNEGDTVDSGFIQTSCCMSLLSISMCLCSMVWLAFALGTKSKKTVLVTRSQSDSQENSDALTNEAETPSAPPLVGNDPISYVQEKFILEISEGSMARITGFSMIVASITMFLLMILLGFISLLMSLGPGLGFSGGTCDSTCETIWSGAGLSLWACFLLFPSGLIALARPWSWFDSRE